MPKSPKHFKVHCSLGNHRKTASMYQDDALLATYTRLGMLMTQRFADRTGDHVICSGRDLCEVAQCDQVSGAVQRLKKLAACSPVVFLDPRSERDASEVPARCRPDAGEVRASQGRVWVLGLPNFAKKQGFGNRNEQETESPSSSSATSTATKKNKTPPPPGGGERPRKPKRVTKVPEPWAVQCAELMIELLRPVPGAQIPKRARRSWALEFEKLAAEVPDLSVEPGTHIEAAIRFALDPERIKDQYHPVIRSGGALRKKWSQLVEAAKRDRKRESESAKGDWVVRAWRGEQLEL